ncbi:hypothetical protein Y601_5296 [Burkholderia pseudomallei MSHR640]|nr:hypothetical protein Y601_5296 [Burkholderia pseudomallei MSHR640]
MRRAMLTNEYLDEIRNRAVFSFCCQSNQFFQFRGDPEVQRIGFTLHEQLSRERSTANVTQLRADR